MHRAGRQTLPAARDTSTSPSSIGIRNASSAVRLNSGSSSMKSTPRCARVISPGRRRALPTRAAAEAV
jgi:hypothetical protein